jgi:hypothetical protein
MSTFHGGGAAPRETPKKRASQAWKSTASSLLRKLVAMSDTDRSFLFWGGIVAITLAFYRFAVFVTPQ